jgi:large conductance mechanosensitive channel
MLVVSRLKIILIQTLLNQKKITMSFSSDFKDFINKGNVVDLAVGVVIGAAFGKIVASVVDGVLMPPIGHLMGGKSFADMKYTLAPAIMDAAGKVTTPENAIMYGNVIQKLIEFIIIALFVFMIVRAYAKMKKAEAEAPAEPTASENLLSEIRDLLKK